MKKAVEKTNLTIIILLTIIIVIMVNYLSFRHYRIWDFTKQKIYSISDKTKKVIGKLDSGLNIIFFQPSDIAENNINAMLYELIKELLERYRSISKNISIENININRDILRSKHIIEKYGISTPNIIIFKYKDRYKIVNYKDLADIDYTQYNYYNLPSKIESFKGESVFTSTILNLIESRQSVVYFVKGHGEPLLNSVEAGGLSKIKKILENSNYLTKTIKLTEISSIPEDCDVLIIAGPEYDFMENELKTIETYLINNGKLIILIDASIGRDSSNVKLKNLLKFVHSYGIIFNKNLVIEPANEILGAGNIISSNYVSHKITNSLLKNEVPVIFSIARSIETLKPPENFTFTDIVSSSGDAWGEKSIEDIEKGVEFNELKDKKGPLKLAVLMEKNEDTEDSGITNKNTKIVFAGDADFITNALAGNLGNSAFFLNIIDYFCGKTELITIPSKSPETVQATLSDRETNIIFFIVVVVMPMVCILTGIFVWRTRTG